MLTAFGLNSELSVHVAKTEMFGYSPMTKTSIGNISVNAIVDTGATTNFISKSVFDSLNSDDYIVHSLNNKIPVLTADLNRVYVNRIIEFTCIIESELITLFAFLAPWLPHGLILGVPFKEQFKDLALTIIARDVKLINTETQLNLSSVTETRRMLGNQSNETYLLWIQGESESTLPLGKNQSDIFENNKDVIVDELPVQATPSRVIKHTIELVPGSAPPAKRPYRISASEKEELDRQIEDLLKSDRIEASTSPFAAPIILVKKKDGSKRLCCDFRGLNDVTVKSKYPLPRIDDLLDMLVGATTFSQLDLVSGYHQVEVDPKDQNKTAFVTPNGQYIWKVMPFGLTNAPSTFQMLMNETLKGLIGKFVLVYLDDILIFSKSEEEHKIHVRAVLNRIRKAKLFAKKNKCHFFMKEVHFLGHTIDKSGIHVDESKVEAMVKWPVPQKPLQAASFLGTAGFYRKFIEKFSYIAKPLIEYSNSKREWDTECSKSFETLKHKLSTAPILLPFDQDSDIVVTTDASDYAVGATLELLESNGKVKGVVAYISAKLSGSQLNWPVREKEGYAVRLALKSWAHYLKGKHFVLKTDHESLKYLHSKRNDSPKIARWLNVFAEFDFEIVYIPGPTNRADGLSRIEENPTVPDGMVNQLQTVMMAQILQGNSTEDYDKLKQGYLKDKQFKEIYEILKDKLAVPPRLRTIIKRYVIRDELLYYGYTSINRNKLCIPDNEIRMQLLNQAHDSAAASHCDAFRTFLNLSLYYHWPKMQRTTIEYVKTCRECQFSKSKTGLSFGEYLPLDVPDDRWRKVNIDFLTGFEKDKHSENDCIMVVIDRLSKMAHFIPMKKKITSQELCDVFLKEVFRLHGIPEVIVSDRDSLFTAAVWDRFSQRLGIKLNMTTSNNPQADGQVERLNRTLVERIRTLCGTFPTSWEPLIPMVEFAYNNSYQSTIHATPFLAANAFHPRFVGLMNPIKPSDRDPMAKQVERKGAKAKLDRILNCATGILEDIRRISAEEQERISQKKNVKTSPKEFSVGERVLLHSSAYGPPGKGMKFHFTWYGPFEISEKVSTNNYRLALRKNTAKHDVFNIKVLKPFVERLNDYGRVPPSDSDIPKNLNLIAYIGDMQVKDGKQLVETSWRDCEAWDTRWLTMDLLTDNLPADFIDYLKRSRNRRNNKQLIAYQEARKQMRLAKGSKRRFPKRGGRW